MEKYEKLVIIYNPMAGRKRKKLFADVINGLKKYLFTIDIIETEYKGHATEIAKQKSADQNYQMIVAAGGDGTINEVINGCFESDIPLGIIPLGTANVLAKEIGLEINAEHIVKAIVEGHTRKIYIPKIKDQHFSLMASVGYDALAVEKVNLKFKKTFGEIAYVFSFIWQLITAKNLPINISVDGKIYSSYGAIITNGKYYGGKFICAPDADIDKQELYVVLFKNKGRYNALRYYLAIITNRVDKLDDIEIFPANHIIIQSEDNAPIQIDGDHYGYLPVTIKTVNKPFKLIVPKLFE